LAAHLAGREHEVVAMYASPLVRAWETARAIGGEIGREPVPREGLAEMDIGDAAGLTFDEWAGKFPEQAERFREDGLSFVWPGGESGKQFARRAAAEIDRILEAHRHESGAVVVVSHGGALAWIISRLLGEPDDRWPSDHMVLDNCSITEVEVPDDGSPATFLYRNEIGHLSPDPDAEAAVGQENPGR
jgi:broad specificity phosphatase PhoE